MRLLARITKRLNKISFLDWILHCIGIHLLRKNADGEWYCRLCGKTFELEED